MKEIPNEEQVSEALIKLALATHERVFEKLKNNKRVTKQVEEDYFEFCELAQNFLPKCFPVFDINKLFEQIPTNSWVILFKEYMSKKQIKTVGLAGEKLGQNSVFRNLCEEKPTKRTFH